jgi:hypothetical protein
MSHKVYGLILLEKIGACCDFDIFTELGSIIKYLKPKYCLTSGSRILLDKLTPGKIHFMKSEYALSCSQEYTNNPYLGPGDF